jgi:hypothetical protein
MKKSLLCLVMLLILSTFSQGSNSEFKRIDQWKHEGAFGIDLYSLVNPQNQLVVGLRLVGNMIITPDKIIKFAPRGEGPDEVTGFKTAFIYKGDLAIVERPDKIKIFTQKGETYTWKETKWIKRKQWIHVISDGIFYDNKFFFAGMEGIKADNETPYSIFKEYSYLKVYAENGDPIKQLIRKNFSQPTQFIQMTYQVAGYKSDRVFFMAENELKVYVVSTKTLEITKEVQLETPPFYKKMPEDFYAWKEYKDIARELMIDVETWDMGYSSIQEIVVDGNYLVVQIRTPVDKMKKFALLFYNAETFKLERTVFLDDYLLDVKDGKYYCYANGNPGRDDNTDECIINIYSFEEKK